MAVLYIGENKGLGGGTGDVLNAKVATGLGAEEHTYDNILTRDSTKQFWGENQPGWYTCCSTSFLNNHIGKSGIIFIDRNYEYEHPESIILAVTIAYNTDCDIKVLSRTGPHVITKARVVTKADGDYTPRVDIYVGSTKSYLLGITTIGGLKTIDIEPATIPEGCTAIEFDL